MTIQPLLPRALLSEGRSRLPPAAPPLDPQPAPAKGHQAPHRAADMNLPRPDRWGGTAARRCSLPRRRPTTRGVERPRFPPMAAVPWPPTRACQPWASSAATSLCNTAARRRDAPRRGWTGRGGKRPQFWAPTAILRPQSCARWPSHLQRKQRVGNLQTVLTWLLARQLKHRPTRLGGTGLDWRGVALRRQRRRL